MSKPIIEVKGISKCYKLGSIGAQTMRDEVEAFFARFKKTKPPATSHSLPATSSNQPLATTRHPLPVTRHSAAGASEFWALRDVSFDVQPGEVVGIIGRNGAGKSTLLKILSRITEPTSGEIRVRGRIASLLEVGTGFHPELSGRENIFLNGAILGMTKAEIRAKFDEIVDFAGVEQFIDTPVKRYSSGMYVRLAFAVAAHLEPEILIVDEVLAVGDAEFQKKCLGKMKDVAGHGRTILFVSHNMDAVIRLCGRAILMEQGTIAKVGHTAEVVAGYHKEEKTQSAVVDLSSLPREGNLRGRVRLVSVELEGGGELGWKIPYGQPLGLVFTVEAHEPIRDFELGIGLFSSNGVEVASALSTHDRIIHLVQSGLHKIAFRYTDLRLVSRQYHFGVGIRSELSTEDYIPEAFSLDVVPTAESASNKADTFGGFVVPRIEACKI
jgi:lipopolysaccharide transport system ATP-binding protein